MIQLVPENKPLIQGLCIGGKASDTDEELIVDSKNLLEVGGDGLQLNPKSPITGNRKAILSHHGHKGTSIILEDRH